MNNELLQRLAREAGFQDSNRGAGLSGNSELDELAYVDELPCGEPLARFAALVAEECAKVVDAAEFYDATSDPGDDIRAKFVRKDAIRD